MSCKLILFTALVCVTAMSSATSPPHPCPCWPEWEPVKDGEEWHCKDKGSDRTFHCNIDIPPTCTCKKNGEAVNLPLGEVNCVNDPGKTYDDNNCVSTPEWEAWFSKYPNYRLYH